MKISLTVYLIIVLGLFHSQAQSQDTTSSLINLETANSNISPKNKFVIMDFEDSILHDDAWFSSHPNGYIDFLVRGKKGSGANKLSLAIGEGRNGSNALLVESENESMGLPGFFIIKTMNKGKLTDKNGYFLPNNRKANRFEFWLRFEKGFRKKSAGRLPPRYPNHRNLHVGTYHFDPTKINGSKKVVESDNWHFYHTIFLRHDKAGSDWIHVVVNQQPQHLRGLNAPLPNNPTMPAGNYFELLTRVYIDLLPYFTDPELPYPAKMWVDDIALSYVNEKPDLTIEFPGFSQQNPIEISKKIEQRIPVKITNNNAVKTCGTLSINAPNWLKAKLIGLKKKKSLNLICLEKGSSISMHLRILPPAKLRSRKKYLLGLTFVNEANIYSDSTSINRSLSDSNVEKRWFPETGPHDGVISSNFLILMTNHEEKHKKKRLKKKHILIK